jgi:hypothetical protein
LSIEIETADKVVNFGTLFCKNRNMKKIFALILLIGITHAGFSQKAGEIQVGIRSTTSLFSHDADFGSGIGGQFRIGLFDRMNTEWFADYITSDIGGLGKRTDGHVGWSVMFYPLPVKERFIQPYILMGHCFDYTHIEIFETGDTQEKWSSAFQTGIGTHFNLSKRTDLSLSAQYMGHLGPDLHVEHDRTDEGQIHIISDPENRTLEGHLLITASFNVKIGQLWSK